MTSRLTERKDTSVSSSELGVDQRPEDEKPFTIVFRNLSEAPKLNQPREAQKIDDEAPPIRLVRITCSLLSYR